MRKRLSCERRRMWRNRPKALHGLQRVRDAKLEEERSRLRQEEEIFFTAAVVIGVILLISILLSFARRR